MRRILTLLTAAILMAAMIAASAAPAFAVPEHFLVNNAEGPPPEALPGLLIAESKTKSEVGSKPSIGDFVITKVVDKATP